MANSGIVWIDIVFDRCVILLYDIAHAIGITYEEINVYLFVFILPLTLMMSIALNIYHFSARFRQTEQKLRR